MNWLVTFSRPNEYGRFQLHFKSNCCLSHREHKPRHNAGQFYAAGLTFWKQKQGLGWPCPLCSPVGGPVVAVVGQEVEVELPKDVEGDAPIGRGHVVVGLAEHGIEAVQRHVLAQQPVSQTVDFQEPLQLLQHIKQQKM